MGWERLGGVSQGSGLPPKPHGDALLPSSDNGTPGREGRWHQTLMSPGGGSGSWVWS